MNATITGVLVAVAQCVLMAQTASRPLPPEAIPKIWNDEALKRLEVPLTHAEASARHIAADYYYKIPVRRIYRSYPIYSPGHEPAGYMEWLRGREPEVVWDYDAGGRPLHSPPLRTREDWIKAGEIVFSAPISWDAFEVDTLRNAIVYRSSGMPVTKDGLMRFQGYVIRKKGQVEVGDGACAACHSRLMSNGSVLKGAQGNNPFDRFEAFEEELQIATNSSQVQSIELERRQQLRRVYSVPWMQPDPHAQTYVMPLSEIYKLLKAIPPGLQARTGTILLYPPQVPDLIGVEHRRYLDHTGLVEQRSIEDMMRYAALNQGMDRLSTFAGFQPASVKGRF
jgi:ribosomal protein L19